MSSRVTSSIASRRARENLVRLLFRHNRDRPPAADATASYANPVAAAADTDLRKRNMQHHSYSQLRVAYIERVHAMHPDKKLAASRGGGGEKSSSGEEECHAEFVELKNAWEEYRDSVRENRGGGGGGGGYGDDYDDDGRRGSSSSSAEENDGDWGGGEYFTMFGVGCSFADSPEERDRRREITDQACRGWFPAGSIPPPRAASGAAAAVVVGAGVGVSRVDCDGGGASSPDDADDPPACRDGGGRPPPPPRGRPPVVRGGPRGVAGLIDESMFVMTDDERRRQTASEGDCRSSAARRTLSLVQDADKFRRKRS
jgi:hypothetical protein